MSRESPSACDGFSVLPCRFAAFEGALSLGLMFSHTVVRCWEGRRREAPSVRHIGVDGVCVTAGVDPGHSTTAGSPALPTVKCLLFRL